MAILAYIVARLKEASTWAGAALGLFGVFGITISADLKSSIISFLISLGGILATVIPEKKA